MAGTGSASEDFLLTVFLNQEFGLSMSYKSFEGGGEVAKELVEGKADSTVNNPSEQEEFYLEGKSAPLSAFTPDRLDMFESVPTFKEGGHDMVYFMQRSVVGPPGMPAEAVEFYRSLFREVYEFERVAGLHEPQFAARRIPDRRCAGVLLGQGAGCPQEDPDRARQDQLISA